VLKLQPTRATHFNAASACALLEWGCQVRSAIERHFCHSIVPIEAALPVCVQVLQVGRKTPKILHEIGPDPISIMLADGAIAKLAFDTLGAVG